MSIPEYHFRSGADLQNGRDSIDSTVVNYTIGMLMTSVWMAERARLKWLKTIRCAKRLTRSALIS
jgi:hypothetical protein